MNAEGGAQPAYHPMLGFGTDATEPGLQGNDYTEPAKKVTQQKVEDELQRGLGNEFEHLGQFARANGQELDAAIPKTKEGDALRSKIHDLTNVQVRQLAVRIGKDMGQDIVGRGKFGGSLSRPELFKELLKTHSPEDISRIIDAEQLNSYAKGTPYVPHDQIALIHEGERIIPKNQNVGFGSALRPSAPQRSAPVSIPGEPLSAKMGRSLGISTDVLSNLRSSMDETALIKHLAKLSSRELVELRKQA